MRQQFPDKQSTVREMLRHATHPHHLRINRHPMLVELIQPDLSLLAYRKLLISYSHLYTSLEGRINQYLIQFSAFQYEERNKLPWLMNDIGFFQNDLPVIDHGVQLDLALPEIESLGQLIGLLYTIEGSTLGGQVISRSLAEYHGLTCTGGACFFNGYGERTQMMWQDFLCFAESISGNASECCAAVDSACQAFQLFEQVINSLSPEQRIEVSL